jgi:hypothetical protein
VHATTVERMIRTPPIVGVPALLRCVSGPSVRTTWPTRSRRSCRMTAGPIRNDSTIAVAVPPAIRKVMYVNRLKTMYFDASGASR